MSELTGFADVPYDLLREIFEGLDALSRIRSMSVCGEWNMVLRDPSLWTRLEFKNRVEFLDLHSLLRLLSQGPVASMAPTPPTIRTLNFWEPEWSADVHSGAPSPSSASVTFRSMSGHHTSTAAADRRGSLDGLHRTSPQQLTELSLRIARLHEFRYDESICPSTAFTLSDSFARHFTNALKAHPIDIDTAGIAPNPNPRNPTTAIEVLGVSMVPYSSTATNFTDDGMLLLLEACPNLKRIVLRGCTSLTDRTVLALGSLCPHLESIELHGFSDVVHGWSLDHVFKSCRRMREVLLDRRLIHCGSEIAQSLSAHCASTLQSVALPSPVPLQCAADLAQSCPGLRELDVSGSPELALSPSKVLDFTCRIHERAPHVQKLYVPAPPPGSPTAAATVRTTTSPHTPLHKYVDAASCVNFKRCVVEPSKPASLSYWASPYEAEARRGRDGEEEFALQDLPPMEFLRI